MDPTLGTLRDIHGLDSVPWWPLAPGWWALFGILCCMLLLAGIRHWYLYWSPFADWRSDAYRQLRTLSSILPHTDPRDIADQLSELLRRIAMAHSGRRQAAGLTGETWLQWLSKHDATGFDWEQRGELLVTAPYMPPAMEVQRRELEVLIRAAVRWIDATKSSEEMPEWKRHLNKLAGSVLSMARRVVRV